MTHFTVLARCAACRRPTVVTRGHHTIFNGNQTMLDPDGRCILGRCACGCIYTHGLELHPRLTQSYDDAIVSAGGRKLKDTRAPG